MGLDVSGAPRVLLGGGIGAGKSTVADVFALHGFHVVNADQVAADLMVPGSDISIAVAEEWPSVASNGVVDRQALALIVFADAGELRRLETLTHPAIADEIARRVSDAPGAVLVEIPLLRLEFSSDWHRIAVIADEKVRIARAVVRGGSAADIRRRVAAQPTDDEWVDWADAVIENGGAWSEALNATVLAIEACA